MHWSWSRAEVEEAEWKAEEAEWRRRQSEVARGGQRGGREVVP